MSDKQTLAEQNDMLRGPEWQPPQPDTNVWPIVAICIIVAFTFTFILCVF